MESNPGPFNLRVETLPLGLQSFCMFGLYALLIERCGNVLIECYSLLLLLYVLSISFLNSFVEYINVSVWCLIAGGKIQAASEV